MGLAPAIFHGPLYWVLKMKKDIHPENYRPVIFRDTTTGDEYVTRSCAPSKETAVFDGQEYPLLSMGISSFSHPFYTGKQTFVDTAGRVDKFQQRAAKAKAMAAVDPKLAKVLAHTNDSSVTSYLVGKYILLCSKIIVEA